MSVTQSAASAHGYDVDLDSVVIRFGGVAAVDNVTMHIGSGECIGLIGPNGAGKTTLLDCLSGLRPPTSGRVSLDGRDVTARSGTWMARADVRRTFQRAQTFGWLSVRDNVRVPLEAGGPVSQRLRRSFSRRGTQSEVLAACDEMLARCGLADVAELSAATIPIGQRRLMEFARALVGQPKLLLLDEPTSGLGSLETERLTRLIADLRSSDRAPTIVLVEHDVELIMDTCDRVVVLTQGRILRDGPPDVVRRDPAVVEAYVGMELMAADSRRSGGDS